MINKLILIAHTAAWILLACSLTINVITIPYVQIIPRDGLTDAIAELQATDAVAKDKGRK